MSRNTTGLGDVRAIKRLVILPADDASWSPPQRAYLSAAAACNGLVEPLLTVLEQADTANLAALPGTGHTAERLRFLAAAASADVTAARVLEPHLDALAILAECQASDGPGDVGQSWGVFAAEGPSSTLIARWEREGWALSGVKPWCSLGGRLSHALVTAKTSADESRLFQVDLGQGAVRSVGAQWVARGLSDVESGPLTMRAAAATPVGEVGWYIGRPGFRWGAIGVAACWWGGCVPLFTELLRKIKRGGQNPLAESRVGRTYRALESARLLLEQSAERIDDVGAQTVDDTDEIAVLAHTVRGTVVDALDETLAATRDILGPAALALDEDTARRFADLEIYASQYHRGLDDASLSAHLKYWRFVVVMFDAKTTVTTARTWLSDPRWQVVEQADVTAMRTLDQLIVFAAHPDDETLGAGGLMAIAGQLSLPVHVIVATGQDSRRQRELCCALDELGVNARIDHLGFPDGALKQHAQALATAITDVLGQSNGPAWAIAPWPGDRHGDHRTLGREVANVAHPSEIDIYFYPVWLWQWGTPDECPWDRMLEVTMSESVRHRKQNALEQFTSQIQSSFNPDGVLTDEFLEFARDGREVLIAPQSRQQQPPSRSLQEHFEQLHAERDDPWSVRTRWYERRKRAITMAALPRERFSNAFEIGCSIGEVAIELVDRCERLLAIDGSESAVTAAKRRLSGARTAAVQRMRVPYDWPAGTYDLIVISEVAYYLADDEWRATIEYCRESLAPGGVIVLCHWLGAADDFAQAGEEAHQVFRSESGLAAIVVHRDAEFLLEVFEDSDGQSHA